MLSKSELGFDPSTDEIAAYDQPTLPSDRPTESEQDSLHPEMIVRQKMYEILSYYEAVIEEAIDWGEDREYILGLERRGMSEIQQIPEARTRGVYASSQEAFVGAGYDQQEVQQVMSFIASNDPEMFLLRSNDSICTITKQKLTDAPLEYIYIKNLPATPTAEEVLGQGDRQGDALHKKLSTALLRHIDTGQTVDLGYRAPCVVELKHGDRVDYGSFTSGGVNNQVEFPEINKTQDLSILLHEVGHAWDYEQDQLKYTQPKPHEVRQASKEDLAEYKKSLVSAERNAWAWAVREVRRLAELGFIIDSQIQENIQAYAEECLSTYDAGNATVDGEFFTSVVRRLQRRMDSAYQLKDQFQMLLSQAETNEIQIPFIGEDGQVQVINCHQLEREDGVTIVVHHHQLRSDMMWATNSYSLDGESLLYRLGQNDQSSQGNSSASAIVSKTDLALLAYEQMNNQKPGRFIEAKQKIEAGLMQAEGLKGILELMKLKLDDQGQV